jgi:hypothetical protein
MRRLREELEAERMRRESWEAESRRQMESLFGMFQTFSGSSAHPGSSSQPGPSVEPSVSLLVFLIYFNTFYIISYKYLPCIYLVL